jgi:hypothetical protein
MTASCTGSFFKKIAKHGEYAREARKSLSSQELRAPRKPPAQVASGVGRATDCRFLDNRAAETVAMAGFAADRN